MVSKVNAPHTVKSLRCPIRRPKFHKHSQMTIFFESSIRVSSIVLYCPVRRSQIIQNTSKSQDYLVQSFNRYIFGFISDTSTHIRILPLTFTMHFQKSTAMVLVTIISQVLGHCVLTSITGANGVTMPGLSVIDGTPRDCARYDALSNPSLIALLTIAVLGVAQKPTHQSSARMVRRWARPMGLARWMQQQP